MSIPDSGTSHPATRPLSSDRVTHHDVSPQGPTSAPGRPSSDTAGERSNDSPAARESARRIGVVEGDGTTADNLLVCISVGDEGRDCFRRDLYVSIQDHEQHVEFLGRVVQGPFHAVERHEAWRALSEESAGAEFRVEGVVELLGQLEDGVRLVPTATRPRPHSRVFVFPATRIQRLLDADGDFYLGHLIGADSVPVSLRSDDKNFLPRNVGIFGTVGSGKSNTMQVLMEQALQAGWAVVAIDVEGEYVRMNEATRDVHMVALLKDEHGLEPRGVDDFHVYLPASGRSGATDSKPFKVPISALEPEIIADILEFSVGQMRMFDAASRGAASRNETLYRSDARVGLPTMTSRSAEPARGSSRPGSPVAPSPNQGSTADSATVHSRMGPSPATPHRRPYTLQDLIDGLQESNQSVPLIPRIRPEDLPTAASLRAKLVHLGRSGVLDWSETAHVPELPIDDLVTAGRLSVLDVSESDDRSRNIAIAYGLQALFERIVQTPVGERTPSGQIRPPLLVVIEEVHTFVSRATAHRMRAVLDNLQIISRRGRKRWMALALVSQQPNHVPDELFELANTRFIHQMKSVSNLDAMKHSTGGINAALWSTVSTLGPGQCLLSGSGLKNALLVAVRPARSQRLYAG